MDFFGNSKTDLGATLAQLNSSSIPGVGNSGGFLDPVHEMDPHTKSAVRNPNNMKDLEYNACIFALNESAQLTDYITLNNAVIRGECLMVGETQSVDRETGAIMILCKWLQPIGYFIAGSVMRGVSAQEIRNNVANASAPTPAVEDQQLKKGKGTLKANRRAAAEASMDDTDMSLSSINPQVKL